MATHELNWSSLLREPTAVDELLEEGDVVLKRRDGEPLRLMRESSERIRREALAAAARLLAASAAGKRPLIDVVVDRLPWTRFLPLPDRRAFLAEFLSQLEACADLGEFGSLGRLLQEWKNTAAAYAEGHGEKLKRPLDVVGAKVSRPGG